ncbi:MAG: cytochrome c [Caldilineales bacterium]
MKWITLGAILLLLVSCVQAPPLASAPAPEPTTSSPTVTTPHATAGPPTDLMARHHAEVPAPYADLVNPVATDDASLTRGAATYTQLCVTCHGERGLGDGPAAATLNPAPVAIANTSQMMSDGYLYWRISEGGHTFDTAMPAWGETLDEQTRWDVINYMRSLGSNAGHGMGNGVGQGMGQGQVQMLNAALTAALITEEDAAFFQAVQQTVREHYAIGQGGGMGRIIEQAISSGQAVNDGVISQEDADRFNAIHDVLMQLESAP